MCIYRVKLSSNAINSFSILLIKKCIKNVPFCIFNEDSVIYNSKIFLKSRGNEPFLIFRIFKMLKLKDANIKNKITCCNVQKIFATPKIKSGVLFG